MKKPIEEKTQNIIVDMYKNKKTVREISEVTGVSRQSIYNILSKHDMSPDRTGQTLDEKLLKKALEYYTVNGYSSGKIGELLGVHAKKLTSEFKKCGAKRATIKGALKEQVLKKYDENVLTIKEISEETNIAPTSIIKLVTQRRKEDPESFVRRPSAFRNRDGERNTVNM